MVRVLVQELHVGDIGSQIVLEFRELDPTDPTGKTTRAVNLQVLSIASLKVFFELPKARGKFQKDATLLTTGVDGKIQYTTVAGDLSASGVWNAQGKLTETNGHVHRSEVVVFTVAPNIEAGLPISVDPSPAVIAVNVPPVTISIV